MFFWFLFMMNHPWSHRAPFFFFLILEGEKIENFLAFSRNIFPSYFQSGFFLILEEARTKQCVYSILFWTVKKKKTQKQNLKEFLILELTYFLPKLINKLNNFRVSNTSSLSTTKWTVRHDDRKLKINFYE